MFVGAVRWVKGAQRHARAFVGRKHDGRNSFAWASLRCARPTLADYRAKACARSASALAFALLAKRFAHGFTDDVGEASRQAVDLLLHAAETAFDPIEPGFDAAESRLDGSKVIAVATGLFEDVTRDHLLALDLVFEHVDAGRKFLSRHVRRRPAQPCPNGAKVIAVAAGLFDDMGWSPTS
jgi:hypothetical protein